MTHLIGAAADAAAMPSPVRAQRDADFRDAVTMARVTGSVAATCNGVTATRQPDNTFTRTPQEDPP